MGQKIEYFKTTKIKIKNKKKKERKKIATFCSVLKYPRHIVKTLNKCISLVNHKLIIKKLNYYYYYYFNQTTINMIFLLPNKKFTVYNFCHKQ